MSKIDDLIAKMCPDGVEFKKLGEFSLLSNTGVDKKLLPNESEVSLLNYLDICRNKKISSENLSAITTASSSPAPTTVSATTTAACLAAATFYCCYSCTDYSTASRTTASTVAYPDPTTAATPATTVAPTTHGC